MMRGSLLRGVLLVATAPQYRGFLPCSIRACSATRLTSRHLNRLLFEPEEVQQNKITLQADDYRASHCRKVLKVTVGDRVRAGILDGPKFNSATIAQVRDGEITIAFGKQHVEQEAIPRIDLLLALQAPIRMERIIPAASSMGLGHLIITGGSKVEKAYWGWHAFRDKRKLRELLIAGLAQAGDIRVPKLSICRQLKIGTHIMDLHPLSTTVRAVAHPCRESTGSPFVSTRLRQLCPPAGVKQPRLLLAIGPESGWAEPEELELFKSFGFQQISLGSRPLRTETAVPGLMALANDWIETHEANDGIETHEAAHRDTISSIERAIGAGSCKP